MPYLSVSSWVPTSLQTRSPFPVSGLGFSPHCQVGEPCVTANRPSSVFLSTFIDLGTWILLAMFGRASANDLYVYPMVKYMLNCYLCLPLSPSLSFSPLTLSPLSAPPPSLAPTSLSFSVCLCLSVSLSVPLCPPSLCFSASVCLSVSLPPSSLPPHPLSLFLCLSVCLSVCLSPSPPLPLSPSPPPLSPFLSVPLARSLQAKLTIIHCTVTGALLVSVPETHFFWGGGGKRPIEATGPIVRPTFHMARIGLLCCWLPTKCRCTWRTKPTNA